MLSDNGAFPYAYACVTLSSPIPSICKYVSLYTDAIFTSFVSLFMLIIIIQSLLLFSNVLSLASNPKSAIFVYPVSNSSTPSFTSISSFVTFS